MISPIIPNVWEEAASRDEDADLLKALTVSSLATLRQARVINLPSIAKIMAVGNDPYPPWPEAYCGLLNIACFEFLEDFFHLDVCLPPFWPLGNAGCPIYRVATLEQAIRSADPALAALRMRYASSTSPMTRREEERVVERAYRRAGGFPRETFLFWQSEAAQVAKGYERQQLEQFEYAEARRASLRRLPVCRELIECLEGIFQHNPMPLGHPGPAPEEARIAVQKALPLIGRARVAAMLSATPLPISGGVWDELSALAQSEQAREGQDFPFSP